MQSVFEDGVFARGVEPDDGPLQPARKRNHRLRRRHRDVAASAHQLQQAELALQVVASAVVNANGSISTGSHPEAGRFTPSPLDPNAVNTVGQSIPDPTLPSSESVDLTGYVPIFTVVSGVNRVIGFGHVAITGSTPGTVQITRLTSRIAPANATRHLTEGFPALSDEALSTVLSLNETIDGALLVPVLAR